MICKKAAQYVSFRSTNDYKLTDPPFFPFLLILFKCVFIFAKENMPLHNEEIHFSTDLKSNLKIFHTQKQIKYTHNSSYISSNKRKKFEKFKKNCNVYAVHV